ncbi:MULTISPECIES: helix-turn-helix domain-containing protein [Clostridium]|uniref:helix-turn-helix domain-containing protein n=1 Tax=Clostridium TaxID=1485 RepID=UPI000825BE2D|nr:MULTISPECIES: helix-turn-helix domain-containing protein [Clostridium]PJI09951.1 helix-turn-helix domain-containing protein [Clostridium sp. CT7]
MQEGNFTIIKNSDITSNLSNGAFRLYVLLKSYCYAEKDNCYPSQKTLADKLNRSIRTIQRYLKELVTKNIIRIRHRGSISNVYTLLRKKIGNNINNSVNKARNVYKSYKNTYKVDEFNNYNQRTYDYKDLEKKLTAWQRE